MERKTKILLILGFAVLIAMACVWGYSKSGNITGTTVKDVDNNSQKPLMAEDGSVVPEGYWDERELGDCWTRDDGAVLCFLGTSNVPAGGIEILNK